jgi:hypothetical protein
VEKGLMPRYKVNHGDNVIEALSGWPEYMFGAKNRLEQVTEGEISMPICLAPTSEGHGVRGFICTVIWPNGSKSGEVEVQGADLDEDRAYQPLGKITYPGVQYSSPSGLVMNFMRLLVTTVPSPPEMAARLMIR